MRASLSSPSLGRMVNPSQNFQGPYRPFAAWKMKCSSESYSVSACPQRELRRPGRTGYKCTLGRLISPREDFVRATTGGSLGLGLRLSTERTRRSYLIKKKKKQNKKQKAPVFPS